MSFRDEPGPRSLSSSLNQQLHTYGLAASTAGVAILALAAPAKAEIVYTQTNREFFQGFSNIDFDHDGKDDVRLVASFFAYHTGHATVSARMPVGNGFLGFPNNVKALSSGAVIGASQHFARKDGIMAKFRDYDYNSRFNSNHAGNWQSINNGYLGVQFQSGGQTHYGWVRISVINGFNQYTVDITDYAYETVANQSIVAGQTSGGAHVRKAELAPSDLPMSAESGPTLGMLAAGVITQPLWRREEESLS